MRFRRGEVLCSEGDDSRDLFILARGGLEILKGKRKIAEIHDSGAPVGEISFLLKSRRTATVRAISDGEAIRVPDTEIERFLKEFPALALMIPRTLAQRLHERTLALHGLRELSDHLPEALIVTDREGRIVSWNTPAESLFGCGWDRLHSRPAEELYAEPQEFRRLMDGLLSDYAGPEKVLRITHPDKGPRYIATKLRAVLDRHHNLAGMLALSRDVSEMHTLQTRYRHLRLWSIPILVFLGLIIAGLILYYPRFTQSRQMVSLKQQIVRDQLARDHLLLKSMLIDPFEKRDRDRVGLILEEFFRTQQSELAPRSGVVLLDEGKRVFGHFAPQASRPGRNGESGSYSDIAFQDASNSSHKVLRAYRVDPDHPMGKKELGIAFPLEKSNRLLGWLLFQMDAERLEKEFDLDEQTLKRLRIHPP